MTRLVEFKRAGGQAAPSSGATVVRDGVELGVFEAYLSSWQPDTGGRFGVPDVFVKGAWLDSLAEHRKRGMRPVRMKLEHRDLIGSYPIRTVREDETGLFAVGEIVLNTAAGRDAWELLKAGALSDVSVGYVAVDDRLEKDVRRITRALLLEASLVHEPANRDARVLSLKAAPAPPTEPASLAGILADLQDLRGEMRSTAAARPRHDAEQEAIASMLADLRAATVEMRSARAPSGHEAEQRALRRMLSDLNEARASL